MGTIALLLLVQGLAEPRERPPAGAFIAVATGVTVPAIESQCAPWPIRGPVSLLFELPVEIPSTVQLDRSFHQASAPAFAGGGATSTLKAADVPAGFFLGIAGHPTWRITQISLIDDLGDKGKGRRIFLRGSFMWQPGNGPDCFFRVWAWAKQLGPFGGSLRGVVE